MQEAYWPPFLHNFTLHSPSPKPPAIHCVNFGKSVSKGFTWGKRNQSCIHPQHWTAIPDVHCVFHSIQPCLRAPLTRYTSAILQKGERGLGTTEGWLVCWACSINWLEMISPGSYSPLQRLLRICLFQGHESQNLCALPICRWLRNHFQGLEKGSSVPFQVARFVTQPSPLLGEKKKTEKTWARCCILDYFFRFIPEKKKNYYFLFVFVLVLEACMPLIHVIWIFSSPNGTS